MFGSVVEVAIRYQNLRQTWQTFSDTYRIQEAFSVNSLTKFQSDRCHNMLREGRDDITYEAGSGRPATSRGEDTGRNARDTEF